MGEVFRKIGRVIQLMFVGLILLAVFGSIYFAPELRRLAKNYSFPEVRIDATVHQDGSMSVIEHRTFDFDGSFSFAYYTLQHRLAGDVTDFSIRDATTEYPVAGTPGTAFASSNYTTVEDTPSEFKATWYFTALDEERTFTFRYRRRCAVELLGDRAYVNWQAIGTGWTEVTEHAEITLHLPGRPRRDANVPPRPTQPCRPGGEPGAGGRVRSVPLVAGDVQAFSHSQLQGEHRIPEPSTVVGEIRDLAPGRFFELSVLFPADAVPFLGPPASPVVGPDAPDTVTSADEVLEIERRLADEANAFRDRSEVINVIWHLMGWSLVPVLILLVVWAFRRDRVPGVPRTLQEPPENVHPAELALLWSAYRGSFAPKDAYRAQLLHLAKQGVIGVVADGRVSDPKDLEVRLLEAPTDPFDRQFVSFLFDSDQPPELVAPVKLSKVKDRGTRTGRLVGWWKYGVRRTKQPLDRLKDGQTRLESTLAFVWAGLTALAGYWAYDRLGNRTGLLLIPAALIGWLVATRLIPPRLPPADRDRLQRWKAFRRFLTEFSNLNEAPALAVIIWEQYLVYATALGVAETVARQVRALIPEGSLPSPWPGAPPGTTGYTWANHFSTHAPAQAAVSSSASVASQISFSGSWGSSSGGGGGGGGSSGGGGGGGGGSGGGAG